MNYSENEIKEKFKQELELDSNSLKKIYCSKMVNYKGRTTDTKRYYTEVISELILDNLKNGSVDFNTIPKISRKSGYKVDSHHQENLVVTDTERKEEILAKKLFKHKAVIAGLGQIIDFQIPLKGVHQDKAGKIDLISYNHENNTAYIIELKNEGNKETLLRAVLEISIYYQQLEHNIFFNSFFTDLKEKPQVKKAVLLIEGCKASNEFKKLGEENRINLESLIEKLEVDVLVLSNSTISSLINNI